MRQTRRKNLEENDRRMNKDDGNSFNFVLLYIQILEVLVCRTTEVLDYWSKKIPHR